MVACGLGPAAAAVLVNNCSCRAWPFVSSLARSHWLVEMAKGAGDHPVLAQQAEGREIDVAVTEARA